MRELSVDAKVVCRNGDAGRITDVIVNPVARRVTHIVVREEGLAGREFLVPLDAVQPLGGTVLRLALSDDMVARLTASTPTPSP